MSTTETTQVEAVRSMTNKQMVEAILALQANVIELQAKIVELSTPPAKAEGKEMTDAHAESVTYGELAALKHKDAAEKLGLTYGQIYSCRLEFTFKNVHKTAKAAGKKNAWIK
jgi:hypothetical protein